MSYKSQHYNIMTQWIRFSYLPKYTLSLVPPLIIYKCPKSWVLCQLKELQKKQYADVLLNCITCNLHRVEKSTRHNWEYRTDTLHV